MKLYFKPIALLLTLISVISLVSCGEGAEKTTEKESDTDMKGSDVVEIGEYLKKYSDTESAEKWVSDNIEKSDIPPISFMYGEKSSDELVWKKTAGEKIRYTDYEGTESPAYRYAQTIVYVCEQESLRLELTLTEYPKYPVVEYDAVLYNTKSGNSETIKDLYSVDTVLCDTDNVILHYNKGTTITENDYEPYTCDFSEKSDLHLQTDLGQPVEAYMPCFNAAGKDGGTIAYINWQGDWTADFSKTDGKIVMKGGQYNTEFVLLENESVRLPGTVLLYYKGDRQEGQNIWRRWIVEHNLMRYTGTRDYTRNIFVCSAINGYKSDLAALKLVEGAKLPSGIEMCYEIDAGWHDSDNRDWTYTGNWQPSNKYTAEGLKEISKTVHGLGMKFCMWFEPERLYYGTELASALEDGCIFLYNDSITYVPYEKFNASSCVPWGVINYGLQKTQDTVAELVNNAVKEYNIDIYRQDFNTHYNQFWHAVDVYEELHLGVSRKGITENHACTGYLNTWHKIAEANPGLIFDACASGGRRYDLETLRFAFEHTKSDFNADIISAQCQNFGISSWYIFNGTQLTTAADDYSVYSRLCLSIGLPVSEIMNYTQPLAKWKNITKYLYKDFYQLTEYSLDKKANLAMQYNDAEEHCGMMIAYLRAGGDYVFFPRGLDENTVYKVYEQARPNASKTVSGKELAEQGFPVSAKDKRNPAAILVLYEKAE